MSTKYAVLDFIIWGGGGVHNLRRIRRCLSQDCLVTLIHTFVTSRLDYSNSLMYGLPQCQISKLRSVQNTAACIALDLSNFSHITPALRQLHWLPVAKGIQFKILLLTFKAIHGLCQTQIYGQYSAATSYAENAAYTWCLLLCCCCCACALEQITC